jgi:hypothetical protein
MSVRRQDFGVTFTVHAGTTKTLELTILDPDTGSAKSLTDTNVYSSGVAKIYRPDGTQVGINMTVTYSDRANGKVYFTVSSGSQTASANAGNWIGEIEFINSASLVVDQQSFNIDIKQNY